MDLEQFFHRDPIADRGISVVMPCFNDAVTLEADVAAAGATLERLKRSHEIIIVDDGSTDATAELVAKLAETNRRVQVARHDNRQGAGAALRSGVALAKYPLVWQLDGGGQFDAADIEKLLAAIDRVDIVCGYRESSARKSRAGLGYVTYRWLLRWAFAVHVRDVDCGFRLFRRAAVRRIPIQSDGRFAAAEILAKATFMNMLIGEAGVSWRPRTNLDSLSPEPFSQTLREAGQVFRRPRFTTGSPADLTPPPTSQAA